MLAERLTEVGVDLLDVSSGGTTPTVQMKQVLNMDAGPDESRPTGSDVTAEVPLAPGYQVPGAAAIRTRASIPTAAVGLITEPVHADEIISAGRADLVMLGRALLRDPYWATRAAIELGQSTRARIPVQYYLGWRGQADFSYLPVSAPLREQQEAQRTRFTGQRE